MGSLAARAGLAGRVTPKPRGWGQSEVGGWAVGPAVLTQQEGQVGAGARGGEQEGTAVAPTPVPAPAQEQSYRWVIWPPGAAGSSPHRAGDHPFSLALIFFFNKNNYEGSKTPFFLDIPALRSQQLASVAKNVPLSLNDSSPLFEVSG